MSKPVYWPVVGSWMPRPGLVVLDAEDQAAALLHGGERGRAGHLDVLGDGRARHGLAAGAALAAARRAEGERDDREEHAEGPDRGDASHDDSSPDASG